MVHLNAVLIALLASIVISAFTIVVTEKMVMCVIVSGALSAVCAFVFVIIGAPDVALAEIAIGQHAVYHNIPGCAAEVQGFQGALHTGAWDV